MRFIFKTRYDQDIDLAKHDGHRFWYGLLFIALLAAPWLLPEYWLAQLTFVFIYAIVAVGLMLLAGFTGQFSIGHAAFMGVGAYTEALLAAKGWPFPLSMAFAMGLAAPVGVVVGPRALGERDRWQRRPDGATTGGLRLDAGGLHRVLLPVLGVRGRQHAGGAQSAAGTHRARLRGDPRFRDLRAEHGHPPGALQVDVVRHLGRAGRPGRCLVCPPDPVSLTRAVRSGAIHRLGAHDRDRWAGLHPWRLLRRGVPDRHAATDLHGQGLPARGHRTGHGS